MKKPCIIILFCFYIFSIINLDYLSIKVACRWQATVSASPRNYYTKL